MFGWYTRSHTEYPRPAQMMISMGIRTQEGHNARRLSGWVAEGMLEICVVEHYYDREREGM